MMPEGGNVLDRVSRVIVRQCRVPASSVAPETRIVEDLCPGSMEDVELILALEDEFRVRIPWERFSGQVTVGHLVCCIERELAGTRTSAEVTPADDS
jgi:acyl carrier protein